MSENKITEEEFRAYLEENYIAYKLWSREDVANELLEAGYADSEENIDEVLNAGVGGLHDCTDDNWQIIQNAIFYAAQNHDLVLSDNTVEDALELIRVYYDVEQLGPESRENMTDAELFPDIRDIGLAFTDITQADVFDEEEVEQFALSAENANTEYPLQVSLDLTGRTVTTTVNGVVVKTITYPTTEKLLSRLGELEFSSLVAVIAESEEVKAKIAYAMKLRNKNAASEGQRLDEIKEAKDLIRKAAALGILNMPDENHVWMAWEFEDGAEGCRKENLLSAAISLTKEKENMDLLKEEIQKKENERKDQQAENTPAEMLAKFIAANWHACPIPEAVTVPNCQCWRSEMCAKCVMEHYDYFN